MEHVEIMVLIEIPEGIHTAYIPKDFTDLSRTSRSNFITCPKIKELNGYEASKKYSHCSYICNYYIENEYELLLSLSQLSLWKKCHACAIVF